MSSLAEEIVQEWLNRQGYFTIRGIRLGVQEIDILAVQVDSTGLHCRHFEVQSSMRPVTYISQVPKAVRKSSGLAANSAKRRTPDELQQGVIEWVEKKYCHEEKGKVKAILSPQKWTKELVVNIVRHQDELDLIETQGVIVHKLADILAELCDNKYPIPGAAGSDLIELIKNACTSRDK
jgi:hypothetical protein